MSASIHNFGLLLGEMGYQCDDSCVPIWTKIAEQQIGQRAYDWDDEDCLTYSYWLVTQQDAKCNQGTRQVCQWRWGPWYTCGHFPYNPPWTYVCNGASDCHQFDWGSTCN
jgi:hypothetical protein